MDSNGWIISHVPDHLCIVRFIYKKTIGVERWNFLHRGGIEHRILIPNRGHYLWILCISVSSDFEQLCFLFFHRLPRTAQSAYGCCNTSSGCHLRNVLLRFLLNLTFRVDYQLYLNMVSTVLDWGYSFSIYLYVYMQCSAAQGEPGDQWVCGLRANSSSSICRT